MHVRLLNCYSEAYWSRRTAWITRTRCERTEEVKEGASDDCGNHLSYFEKWDYMRRGQTCVAVLVVRLQWSLPWNLQWSLPRFTLEPFIESVKKNRYPTWGNQCKTTSTACYEACCETLYRCMLWFCFDELVWVVCASLFLGFVLRGLSMYDLHIFMTARRGAQYPSEWWHMDCKIKEQTLFYYFVLCWLK